MEREVDDGAASVRSGRAWPWIDATTDYALKLTGASVTVGPCSYSPWPALNNTLASGALLAPSETRQHKCEGKSEFKSRTQVQ